MTTKTTTVSTTTTSTTPRTTPFTTSTRSYYESSTTHVPVSTYKPLLHPKKVIDDKTSVSTYRPSHDYFSRVKSAAVQGKEQTLDQELYFNEF